MSKAATRAKDKYNAKTYEDIRIRVKNGEKAPIENAATGAGMSINAFILEAVREKMEKSR
jgi:uncharacterized protein (DUF1778 family)